MSEKTMDQLSADATMALKLGMSYGKLQALRHEGILQSRTEGEQLPVAAEKNRKGALCKICGKPVPNNRRNYCSEACANIGNRENAKLKWHRRYSKNKK